MNPTPTAPSVVVVGGGVSGLAAAHRLTELDPALRVTVVERAEASGGLIKTAELDGCLVELGPDSILTEKPQAVALAKRLGLEGEIIGTRRQSRGAYVVCRGKLERIPDGFSMMAPAEVWPILTTNVLSWSGKARLALETLLPRGPGGDESVGHFVGRRFGREVKERLAQPLMGGIYGTDIDLLSLSSTMPRFATLEAEHRSVTLGVMKRAKRGAADAASGARYGLFISFERGVQTLTNALAAQLGERLWLGTEALAVEAAGSGFRVVLGSQTLAADAVVLALPAGPMARLVSPLDEELSRALLDIPYGSTAAVTLCYPRDDIPHPLDAFGFVVPKIEQRRCIASTWASVKFEGRAPSGRALLRVFFGGDGSEALLAQDDAALVAAARAELEALLGVRARPVFSHVVRHTRAMPRYLVGHHDRVRRIEGAKERHPRLELAGNSMYGVGIPDAVRSGERAAERVIAHLRQRTSTV